MDAMGDELMPDNAVASLVSPWKLAKSAEIDIPDVQRGLVWNPTQIAELWKSIFDGYPIGALTVYRQGEKWQLIDGQQRWHAIKMGLNPDEGQRAMTILWTVWEKELGKWTFKHLMVSTRRHPWGFVWNKQGDRLERLPHGEMVEKWNNMLPQEKKNTPFVLPTLKDAENYLRQSGECSKWIPLYELLSEDLYELLSEDFRTDDNVKTQVDAWRERVQSTSIPLIRFNLQGKVEAGKNRIHELFTRINKGGTPISNVDYTYSTLCSYLGIDFKNKINRIAKGFIPPNRVARLYARLKYAEESEESKTSSLLREPPHSSYWGGREYDAEIGDAIIDAIENAKSMYPPSPCGIPQTVYLQAGGDEWLTVVTWCRRRFPDIFPDMIQGGDRSHQNLLCMLPYVVCRDPGWHAKFCNRFYEALKDARPTSLINLLAIGVAYAACYSMETGMYPVSKPNPNETPEIKREYPYDKEWLHVLCNENNEPLLHFLQRSYMHKMLQEACGFYPHETATWGEAMNRPWDVDHIVPQSRWWLLQPEEVMFRESLPNRQILYYRRNREKHDCYIGVPKGDGISPEDDFCYSEAQDKREYFGWEDAEVYKAERPFRLHQSTANIHRREYEGYLASYIVVVNKRFAAMIQRLFDTLPLDDLIQAINDLPEASCAPPCLHLPIVLWKEVLKKNTDLTWCSVRHDQSKQQIIATKDFYHSLCQWLAVGKEVEGAFHCICWNLADAKNLNIAAGCRRLPNQTVEEWRAGSTQKAPRNDWWVENPISPSTCGVNEDLVKELQQNLRTSGVKADIKLISDEQ